MMDNSEHTVKPDGGACGKCFLCLWPLEIQMTFSRNPAGFIMAAKANKIDNRAVTLYMMVEMQAAG